MKHEPIVIRWRWWVANLINWIDCKRARPRWCWTKLAGWAMRPRSPVRGIRGKDYSTDQCEHDRDMDGSCWCNKLTVKEPDQ